MSDTLSCRERYLTAFRHEESDRVPLDRVEAVCEAIELCAAGGGFVIMPVPWIETGGSFEKIRTAVDAVKRHGAYS